MIDKFVGRKQAFTRNPDKFRHKETIIWLKWLATFLKEKEQLTFELSNLQPKDLNKRWLFGLVFGLIFGLIWSLLLGLIAGLVLGSVTGLFFGLTLGDIETKDIRQLDFTQLYLVDTWAEALFVGLFCGILFGFVFFVINLLSGFFTFMFYGLVYGLVFGLVFGLVSQLVESCFITKQFADIASNYQRLRAGIVFTILEVGIISSLMYLLILMYKPPETFTIGLFFIMQGFAFGALGATQITSLWRHFILRFCFYCENAMPLKYATFLDYAAQLRILEKDGGQWRFRHQNLHNYFVNLK